MKTKSFILATLFLSFAFFLRSPSSVRAQQEDDDPNWRQRRQEEFNKRVQELIKAQKEIERLRNEIDELKKRRTKNIEQLLELQKELDPFDWSPRSLNLYEYPPGHPYGPRISDDIIIMYPRLFSDQPFRGIERDILKSIENSPRLR
jgi:long-subunit acyl-CoA synthetase (AMP-forming)